MWLDVPSDQVLRGPVWLGVAGRRWPLAASSATRATVNRPVSVGGNARDLYYRAGRRRPVAGLRRHLLSRASVQ
jgi:hypothetical protein